MMQMNVLQRLDELIEESREIEAQAEKLQAGGPLHSANSYAVQQFQTQTQSWYANVLELLPHDLGERFEHEWTGPEGNCGLQHFVSDPTGWDPHGRQVYSDEYLWAIDPTKVLFAFPFDRCFQEPLRRQRKILVEAKHHPNIARSGHFDERGVAARFDFNSLHPQAVNAAGALFADGYYRNAILQACIALSGAVKEKSGIADKDGTPLMQQVFASKNPVLRVSENDDERLGMMWLFTGATMALRNPRAHHLGEGADQDATEAFEWLAFLSALMRVIDRAERIATDADLSG